MNIARRGAILIFMFGVILGGGCAVTQLNSVVTPNVNLSNFKEIYVVHLDADGRGIDKLIATRLAAMGYKVSNGPEASIPKDPDAIVTYQDKWMWDITMYMIELNIQIRDPKTNIAVASGHSLRTSLARKSPEEMVEEVLTKIFNRS